MHDVLSHQTLSDMIGDIYDCALDPSRWEATLARVANWLDCTAVSLTLNDLRRDRFLINKSAGWDPDLLRRKSERHVAEINARLTEWLALQPSPDEMFVASRHLGRDYMQTSHYAQECLKPQDIVDVMHMFLLYTPAQLAEIGLSRSARQGAITDRELQRGRLLLPHLRRAVTISDLLDVRTIERARLAETLDALRCGVVLTDAAGTILHVNRSAEHMMRHGGPIRDVRGVLRATTPAASRDLRTAIMQAAQSEARFGSARLAIQLNAADHPPSYAHVLPMTAGELRARLQPEAVAAVFIGVPDEDNGAHLLAAAFDLTAAETRVLASLLAGHTLAETAHHLDVALSTAKTHLNHIFAKVGVSRQTELIRLAAQLARPVHPPPS